MLKHFIIFAIAFQYLQSQTLDACKKLNVFYDLAQQQCGVCPIHCSNCDDMNSCLSCQSQTYYDQSSSQCVSQCQLGASEQDFYQNCINCQVENCDICQFEGIECKQCRKGWQLSENKMYCQKSECLSNDYSFYYPLQNECTLNCPEYYDQNERQCINLRKISQIQSVASRSNFQQADIDYVLFFQEINSKPLVVALNSQNAILYSYPDLIPLNQINLLNSYVRVAQDNKNVFLLSTLNIQQINLESQSIQISYQVVTAQNVSYSQDSYFLYNNQTLQVYNFIKGQQLNYNILNETIFVYYPSFFSQNVNGTTTNPSPTPTQPSPAQNSSKILIQNDSQGCTLISQNSSLIKPISQKINFMQIDALNESQIIQQNIINLYQDTYKFTNFQSDTNIVTLTSFVYMLQTITSINIFDLNNKNLIAFQFQSSIQPLAAFQIDGKIRLVVIKQDYFQGFYQSVISCANLTRNQTTNQYYQEYDQPHYAQSTSKIIEYLFIENNNYLILATQIGYEVINISPQISQTATNSSQNLIYLFNNINNNLFSHSKFFFNSQSIYYEISNQNIYLQLLNFENQMFSNDTNRQQIVLNSINYDNFNLNFNQIKFVNNQTIVVAYKNQLQIITFPNKNQNQTILYSNFVQQDSSYYMGGIQKILYSNDSNFMAIIFNRGFRVIQLESQKQMFEKNLRYQIINAEVVSQYLVVVFKTNLYYNYLLFDADKSQMFQSDTQFTSIYITLIKQQSPQILFVGIYYSSNISLLCISSQKIDAFRIDASPQLTNYNLNSTIQVINNNVYVSTIEFYILIFTYDQTNSVLTQIDSILTLDSFFAIDSSNTIVVSACSNSNSYVLFNRVSRQNYVLLIQKLIPGQVIFLQVKQSRQYSQIVFSPPQTLLGSARLTVFNLITYKSQTINLPRIFSSSEQSFIANYGNQYYLFSYGNLTNTTISFPLSTSILNLYSNIYQIQNTSFIIVSTALNATQVLFKGSNQNSLITTQSNQIVLYSSSNLISQYVFNQNNLFLPDINIQLSSYQLADQAEVIAVFSSKGMFIDLTSNIYLNISLSSSQVRIQSDTQLIGQRQLLLKTSADQQFAVKFIIVTQQYLNIVNYMNCTLQSTPLQGIQFQQISGRNYPAFIILDRDLDTVVVISQNRLNIFQYSTAQYLGSKDYSLIYQDIFLVTLYQGMHLIELNKNQSKLLEYFSNFLNPRVFQIQFAYLDQQNQILSEIKLRCYSDSNMFDISYPLSSNNIQTDQMLATFIQSPYLINNINQHSDLQSRIRNQNLKLAKYQILMNIQSSNLIEIQKFYDVFTQDTIIEYQFSTSQDQKGIANVINNNFVLPLFYQLSFQTISLQLALNQTNFALNPYSNLVTVKFSIVDLIFNSSSNSQFLINNLNLLILDLVTIQDQIIDGLFSNIKIFNVTTVLIVNMRIENIQLLNQPLFTFQSVNNITFQNLTLQGVSLNSNLFQFIECQNIQIQDTTINQLKIKSGNFIQIIKNDQIQIFNFNVSQAYLVAQLQRMVKLEEEEEQQQRNLQSSIIELSSIINLKGCQNVIIYNVNLDNIQDVSFVQINHYSIGYQLQYFSNQISIANINVQQFNSSKHGNYIISITSVNANLTNFIFGNITSSNNLINLNVQLQVLIQDSQFQEINLLSGSVFSMQQGQLDLSQSQFRNINCSGLPCALYVISADLVFIENSKFNNLNNAQNNQTKNNQITNYKGGAVKILNTNSTIIKSSLFSDCSSLQEGGAIYIQQQQQGTLVIQMSNFTDNESKLNSGGALYLSELSQVSIVQNTFLKNVAIHQKGGSLYLDNCTLQLFQENSFIDNTADIGGAIYYYKTDNFLLSSNMLLENQNFFSKNKGIFYGKNIGSFPFWIGISENTSINSLSIVEEFSINSIASGNYLERPLYINFIDEENNPLNFLGSDTLSDRSQFFFQLYFQNNSQIIIQEGIYPQLNKSIGLFVLNFQSIYKVSQNQTIYLTSNEFQTGSYLSIPIKLNFRDCQVGEIIQEKDQFIQCNQCVQGRYSLKVPNMNKDINQLQCFSCPGEAYFCQGSEIKLKDGYWRENNQTDQIYKCILESCSYDNAKSKYGCLPGFMGPLCNSCDSKQSIWNAQYGFKNNYCYVCKSGLQNFGFLCFFILFYFFYIFYSQQNIINNQIKNIKLKIFKQIGLLITSKLSSSGNDMSLQFKIFIHYLQILSCLLQFGVFSSNILAIPLNLFGDPISLTVYSLDCLINIDDKYPIWLHRIIAQIFSILIISLLSVIFILIISLRQYKNQKEAFRKLPQKSKMIQIYIYIFYQPSISKILIQSLICTKIGENYYLLSDFSQQCYDYYHRIYSLTITIPLIIIWCFLIPLKLYFKLKSIQKLDQMSQKVVNLLTYGIIYNGYKNKFLYWEIIKIAHKFFLMVIINLAMDDNIKLTIILSSIILYMHELSQKQPHQNQIQFQQEKSITLKLVYSFQLVLIVVNDFTESKLLSMISTKIQTNKINQNTSDSLFANQENQFIRSVNTSDVFMNVKGIQKSIFSTNQTPCAKFQSQFDQESKAESPQIQLEESDYIEDNQTNQDQRVNKCVSQCQRGDSQQKFFKQCVECQVQNCDICYFEGTKCVQCQQGWKLSENSMYCQKDECLFNDNSFYNPFSKQCTFNCPEYSDQNGKLCTNLRKLSSVKSLASRSKIQQTSIDYVLFFEQINDKPMPHFAQSSYFILEYTFLNDNNLLMLATAIANFYSDEIQMQQNSQLIGRRQLLTQTSNDEFAREDYQMQNINLTLIDSDSILTCETVLDFAVIQYNNSYTLVIATSLSLQVFNMQTNKFIGDLPTSCQSQLKFKQDEEYLYLICSFQVTHEDLQSRISVQNVKLAKYQIQMTIQNSNLIEIQTFYDVFTQNTEVTLVYIDHFSVGYELYYFSNNISLQNINIYDFNYTINGKYIISIISVNANLRGAIKVQNTNSTIVNNTLFSNCSATQEGGAIYISQQQQATFILQMSNFTENESKQNSGGALFLSGLSLINITQSLFVKNKALHQKGGAIFLESCSIQRFQQNNFTQNAADIGGAIYYFKTNNTFLQQNMLLENEIYLQKNIATFYGKNIGSVPFWIGITEKPSLDSLKKVDEFSIDNIASGNYLEKPLYVNFIDEEYNPLNFFGSDTLHDRSQFFFQLQFQNNSQIIIQEGINAQLNQQIGLFVLKFQPIYKSSQNQTIYLTSNEILSGSYLSIPLRLHFRDCVIGEIISEKDNFIQCNQCVQGRYSLKVPDMHNDINQLQCFSCPQEAYFCQGSQVKLKDGFWRESNETDQIYQCILDGCSYNNTKSKYGCLPGFIGPLCNSCDSKQSIWEEQYGFKNNNCHFGVFTSNILVAPLSIFGDPVSFTIYSLDCLFKMSDAYPIWLNRIVSQLFSILIIFLLSIIFIISMNLKQYKNTQDSFKKIPQKANVISIYIYIFYQPSISKILIQSLICTKIGENYYLISDYSQQCYDYYHKIYSLAIVIPLIVVWCFLIPLMLFYKLKSFQKVDQYNVQMSQKVNNLLTYGIIYNGYKSKFLYWEIIKIAHKILLMSNFSRFKIQSNKPNQNISESLSLIQESQLSRSPNSSDISLNIKAFRKSCFSQINTQQSRLQHINELDNKIESAQLKLEESNFIQDDKANQLIFKQKQTQQQLEESDFVQDDQVNQIQMLPSKDFANLLCISNFNKSNIYQSQNAK
ncbi:hypothetical protein ABPG73_006412 [Tetrahymena malaccensis]